MAKVKMDLRMKDYQEAIIKISSVLEDCPLTERAIALLLADSTNLNVTQATTFLRALPELKTRYLKGDLE